MKIKINLLKTNFVNFFRPGPNLYSIFLTVAAAIVIISTENTNTVNNLSEYESGKVAARDIIAGHTVTFIDEEATNINLEAIERNVPAVFRFSSGLKAIIINSWNDFCDSTNVFSQTEKESFRNYGIMALELLLKQGIFETDHDELKNYHPDIAELLTFSGNGSNREFIYYRDMTTKEQIRDVLGNIIAELEAPNSFKIIALDLLEPLVRENVYFSISDTQRRVLDAKELATPVTRTIEKGKKIIRKGFIITDEAMTELMVLNVSTHGRDIRSISGYISMVLLFCSLFIILRGSLIMGRILINSERYLLSTITGFYIIGSVLLKYFSPAYDVYPISLFFPTALMIMILAVFLGTRPALIMSLVLPLGAYLAGAFDLYSYIVALVSGVTAATVLHNIQSRMGLIKAGLVIALTNCFAVIVTLLLRNADLNHYPLMLFGGAMNGIISGMLIMGFLPLLEQVLNAVTPFRLMELSDLNAPILRKLFTVAPGTYTHSLMVANLAEQACQDIGANALLARVSAYYHDIGKMDNPEYFVENQTNHNKHNEIAPRLSATVIRSHLKLGVEKAHSLGLPKDIISIIGEHHGNSLISWFYNKAIEQKEAANTEDFC